MSSLIGVQEDWEGA